MKKKRYDLVNPEWADGRPLTTRCLHCDWTHQGTTGEGREAALKHRQAEHPQAGGVKHKWNRMVVS